MKLLLIGGAGYLGTRLKPYLTAIGFSVKVFDCKCPVQSEEFVEGSIFDASALRSAMADVDFVVYLAMGKENEEIDEIHSAYDVNVKGVHLALDEAVRSNVKSVVFTSTLSIYRDHLHGLSSEDLSGDAINVYGFTKWLGEEVCRLFSLRRKELKLTVLRLCSPLDDAEWVKRQNQGDLCCTRIKDIAKAIGSSLLRDGGEYEAFFITGDKGNERVNMSRAKDVIQWEPT